MGKHVMAGSMAGAVIDGERQFTHRHGVAILQPAVRFERHTQYTVAGTVLFQPVDPEFVGDVRSLDPHPELVGEQLGGAAMVDMAVGEQYLLDRHALRSEEHTSELQSLMRISYAVFCLKKKNYK